MKSLQMKSLSRSFLIGLGATSVTIAVVGSIVGFFVLQEQTARERVEHLREYVDERVVNVSQRFATLGRVHAAAAGELTHWLQQPHANDVERAFDERFPLQGDGTRRSRPEDFDGHFDREGAWVYGMGAFLPKPETMTGEDKRVFSAAFQVVSHFGEGIQSGYDNFYFATPQNRLVIFAPKRPDRLMFYRHDAPATLDFSGEEMMRISTPAANPLAQTRCTSLQRYIQDTKGVRAATACLTPVYDHGRYIGVFGSSLSMTDFLTDATRSAVKDATTLIVRGQGDPLAASDSGAPGALSLDRVATLQKRFDLVRLMSAIRATGRAKGVIRTADGSELAAFGKIEGTEFYLLLLYPERAVQLAAMKASLWILLFRLIAACGLTFGVVFVAKRILITPLRDLAESCTPENVQAPLSPELLARADEIGVLARSLQAERENKRLLLDSLEKRVGERTAELEHANQEKSRFLANMSHELRTPMNGIVAVAESLLARQTDDEARGMAQLIIGSSRLLERVLSDVLDFSSLEAGSITLLDEPFDMEALVARTAELHRAVAQAKGLDFTCHVASECKGRFVGDSVRVQQIVSNLLSNAVKFTEKGWVALRLERAGENFHLVVTDTGLGFGDEVRERLFQRFEQADPSIRRRFGGTGLGLAISQALAEKMGGRIRAASRPGQGSTFTFEFPMVHTEAGVRVEAAPARPDGELAGLKVLLAEDHPTNQQVVALILGAVGVDLTIVGDGQAALDVMAERGFDAVLMDMQMPELDGLAAVRQLRAREASAGAAPRTPVIMLTANALREHIAESLAAGADRHLTKPIRTQELLEALAEAVSPKPSPSAPTGAKAATARKPAPARVA